jgi:hypothetical protein
MKLSFTTFAFSLLVGASAMKAPVSDSDLRAAGDKRRLEQDFMRAMHDNPKLREAKRKQREQQRKRQLLDKLMEHATPRHLADNGSNGGEYSFEDSYEWMNPVYQQMIEDGVFDLTARAFKYSGCAAIKSFDPDRAQENGNPMVVDTYAVFRLCPEDTCNKYSLTGCGKNYGEYVVSMATYLQFMLDFYEDHYGAYCEYCYPCDYDYQVAKHNAQATCYDNMEKNEYQQKQTQQQQAWQNYYEQNYGDMSQYYQQQQDQENEYQQQYQQQQATNQQMYSDYVNNGNGYTNANVNYVSYNSGNSNGGYNNGGYNNGGNRKLDETNANGQNANTEVNANAYGNGYGAYSGMSSKFFLLPFFSSITCFSNHMYCLLFHRLLQQWLWLQCQQCLLCQQCQQCLLCQQCLWCQQWSKRWILWKLDQWSIWSKRWIPTRPKSILQAVVALPEQCKREQQPIRLL